MRTIVMLSAAILSGLSPVNMQRMDDKHTADLQAIEALHQKDSKATLEYDVDTLSSILAEDVVALPPSGPPTVGRAKAREGMEKGRKQSAQFDAVEYSQDWQDIQIDGDHAYEWGYFTTAVRPKAGGGIIRNRYKVLRVLERQPDGSWQVLRTMWNEAPHEQ
jgi:ketosteroid isomerase-like protein